MTDYWFYNPNTKLLYRIISMAEGKIKLKALEAGLEFEDDYTPEAYKKAGYELMTTAQVKELGLIED
jgi:hypothetical protein